MNLEHFHVCPEAAALAVAGVQRENHPLSHYSEFPEPQAAPPALSPSTPADSETRGENLLICLNEPPGNPGAPQSLRDTALNHRIQSKPTRLSLPASSAGEPLCFNYTGSSQQIHDSGILTEGASLDCV